jgi:hypothetical protein
MTSEHTGEAVAGASLAPEPKPSIDLELFLWRIANPIMMGLLGWAWFGAWGAAAGPLLYALIAFGPRLAKRFAPPLLTALGRGIGSLLGGMGSLFSPLGGGRRP